MPVKAAEHPTHLGTVLKKDSPDFSAQTVRNKIVTSASISKVKEKKSAEVTQVAAEVKTPEVKTEAKTNADTKSKPQTKPVVDTKKTQKPTQVASATTQVSRGGTPEGSTIVENAQSLLGVPYVFGGTSRNGFDCSGLTQYVFKGSGISLPRTSYDQFGVGTAVNRDQLQSGDLVFFTTYAKGASHVGIYIGGNRFIHAGSSGVQTTSLSDSYYSARYLGARRVQ
jgi:cell wall-associated NlpC family hydrolase